jgi:hypothetical protein
VIFVYKCLGCGFRVALDRRPEDVADLPECVRCAWYGKPTKLRRVYRAKLGGGALSDVRTGRG